MLVKRLGVMLISFILGFILTWGIILAIGTTIGEYGPIYTFFTSLTIGCAIGIWIDKFVGTEMLPK
jgi:hypothetical protein